MGACDILPPMPRRKRNRRNIRHGRHIAWLKARGGFALACMALIAAMAFIGWVVISVATVFLIGLVVGIIIAAIALSRLHDRWQRAAYIAMLSERDRQRLSGFETLRTGRLSARSKTRRSRNSRSSF